MISEKEVEIFEYNGPNYDPTMNSDGWRVAFLNYGEETEKENLRFLERHHLTDEVFVLLKGEATLIVGKEMKLLPMEPYKIYNVKKDIWHSVYMSKDAKILIVENHSTSPQNSEYYYYR
ncbi:MAG TPA: hypothetical protein PKY53_01590 [Clostridia bacterium]|jgi:mannose-6-phosphate isomerase-like protein (cupin superfamily)|nr:hypothetical protein [Clostridia bacterium]